MKNLTELKLQPLSNQELENTQGGAAPLVGAAAIAAGCGLLLGAFVVGAVVAYGVCYLLDKSVRR